MKRIPVVFCFDDNLILAAGVCISSLLENALPSTFYDIYILHDESARYPDTAFLDKLSDKYSNFNITYRSVGKAFRSGFETRGITYAAYYRLLIPEIVPEYDKIMYHDVDVIFRHDLSALFEQTTMSGQYVAGVLSPGILNDRVRLKRERMGLNPPEYLLSGNLMLNAKLLREDGIVEKFKNEVAGNRYEHQDMGVLNIVCVGKTIILPPEFCGTVELFRCHAHDTRQPHYSPQELNDMHDHGIVHYNGAKPWNQYCPNFDIWWEYYRKSPFYEPEFYFDFYYNKLDEYDRLPLWKRVKILLRYLKVGVKK